ncbi:hypothetical protein QNH23_14550 [Siminovitchia fortis]|uniref:Uncharacterized protein n=1 Tax=Siminovitchia fortis TaxID=254758 RepID=A0A443IJ04_9BACI|nr:hypothetical protein [Siminovitchia fortis]RWR04054.1 hypothetical protein D4N35_017590 [Siminovitchia fortis]WHY81108.1 hypothetical protein QNH23_14550 [Siminovitchia fortis]
MNQLPEVKVFKHSFASPEEYQEFLCDLQVSSQFKMRYRGLYQYYGKDLIAFKREKPRCMIRNEFLQVFSSYMTDYLEDHCPPSWNDCHPPFWEELIFAHFPHHFKVTEEEKEVENFLSELNKFVKRIDKNAGTRWTQEVRTYSDEALIDLKICERLLNRLFLKQYPDFHKEGWDFKKDFDRIEHLLYHFNRSFHTLFQVIDIIDETVILEKLDDGRIFHTRGLPVNIIKPDLLFFGTIGQNSGQFSWRWLLTEGIYPERAKPFMLNKLYNLS